MTSEAEVRARNSATLLRALSAVGDVAAQTAEYTDDAVVEFPYADPPKRLVGKPAITGHLTRALEVFELRLTVTRIHETADPDTLVVEFTGAGEVTTTGKPYTNTYIAVMAFRGGLIASHKEFYDPNAALRALTPDA